MRSTQMACLPRRHRSAELTTTMTAGSVRGKCCRAQEGFVHTRMCPPQALLEGCPAMTAEVVLPMPPGDGPGVGQECSFFPGEEGAQGLEVPEAAPTGRDEMAGAVSSESSAERSMAKQAVSPIHTEKDGGLLSPEERLHIGRRKQYGVQDVLRRQENSGSARLG